MMHGRLFVACMCAVLLAGCPRSSLESELVSSCPPYALYTIARALGDIPLAEEVNRFVEEALLDPCARFKSIRRQREETAEAAFRNSLGRPQP